MCRLSVDHRNFTRIDVDESFKCRTEYRILKYERVKKYTFKGVKREGQEQVKSPEFVSQYLDNRLLIYIKALYVRFLSRN